MQQELISLVAHHINFEIKQVKALGRGTDSAAFLVNGTWVFRIPLNTNAYRTLEKEVSVLPVLAAQLPIKVPEFSYTGGETPRFSGYPVLEGEPLTEQLFSALSPSTQDKVVGQIYQFLATLHSIPIETVPVLKEEVFTGAYNFGQRHLYDEVSSELSSSEFQKLERVFKEYDAKLLEREATSVIHADLKPAHVLFHLGAVSGVLDWGDVCLGDADFDFAVIQKFFGQDFLMRLLQLAPDDARQRILWKVPLFLLVRALQDVVYSRTVANDDNAAAMSLKALRKQLRSCNWD